MIGLLAVLSTLVSVAIAQDNGPLRIQAIEAEFEAAYIVPDLLESFSPTAYLDVSFGGSEIDPGQLLTPEESSDQPVITVTAAETSTELPDTFTLALVDPGAIGVVNGEQTRHWLVNGVTVGADGTLVIPETAVTPYGGPFPPETESAHRYVFLLYEQPASWTQAPGFEAPLPIEPMNINEYAETTGLGPIVAASYFTVTRGDVEPVTVTEAVDTATLPAAQSSPSGSQSNTRSSPSGTPTTTAENNAGLKNGASLGVAGVLALAGFVLA